MLGPLLLREVDQRRVERVAPRDAFGEPFRSRADPRENLLVPMPVHVLLEPSGRGGGDFGGWLIREEAATDDLGEVAATGDRRRLAVANQEILQLVAGALSGVVERDAIPVRGDHHHDRHAVVDVVDGVEQGT